MRSCLALGAALAAIALSGPASVAESSQFAVVGYLPHYRGDVFRREQAKHLTDLILFSVEPKPDGTLDESRLPAKFVASVQRKTAETDVRKLVTVGGWGKSTAFATVTAQSELRERLVRNLSKLCDRHDLDGIDVDWEHPTSEEEHAAFARFLHQLREALGPHGRLVTVAMAPWKPLSDEALSAVDRIHLMTYDNGGRHSTLDLAFDSVDRLLDRGIPAEKICLGIPFYGRPFEGPFGETTTYAEIVSRSTLRPSDNEANGIYFNGPELVARKVRLARRLGLGGVMIWELGQDVADPQRSLLNAIDQTVDSFREASP